MPLAVHGQLLLLLAPAQGQHLSGAGALPRKKPGIILKGVSEVSDIIQKCVYTYICICIQYRFEEKGGI